MKFIIEGSQSELTELIKRLGGIENEAKNAGFPPLLTGMANAERTIECTREIISFLKKSKEVAEQSKGNAPQAEIAEKNSNQEFFEKQMKLLSEASEFCTGDIRFTQNLPALTCDMIDLHKYQGRLS